MIKKKKAVKKSSPASIDYDVLLIKSLKNKEHAVAYLNAALEESLKGDDESQWLFANALKHVAQAQGDISKLAKRAHLKQANIKRMLAEDGKPEIIPLTALLHAMGLGVQFYTSRSK